MPFVIRLKEAPRYLGVNLQGTMTNEPNDGIINSDSQISTAVQVNSKPCALKTLNPQP